MLSTQEEPSADGGKNKKESQLFYQGYQLLQTQGKVSTFYEALAYQLDIAAEEIGKLENQNRDQKEGIDESLKPIPTTNANIDLKKIHHAAKRLNIIIGILDTRSTPLNYRYFYLDGNQILKSSTSRMEIALLLQEESNRSKRLVKLAFTGKSYMAILKEPKSSNYSSLSQHSPSVSSSSLKYLGEDYRESSNAHLEYSWGRADPNHTLLSKNRRLNLGINPDPRLEQTAHANLKSYRKEVIIKVDAILKKLIQDYSEEKSSTHAPDRSQTQLLSLTLGLFNHSALALRFQIGSRLPGASSVPHSPRRSSTDIYEPLNPTDESVENSKIISTALEKYTNQELIKLTLILKSAFFSEVVHSASYVKTHAKKYVHYYLEQSESFRLQPSFMADSQVVTHTIINNTKTLFGNIHWDALLISVFGNGFARLKSRDNSLELMHDNEDIFLKSLIQKSTLSLFFKGPRALIKELQNSQIYEAESVSLPQLIESGDSPAAPRIEHLSFKEENSYKNEPASDPEDILDQIILKTMERASSKLEEHIVAVSNHIESTILNLRKILSKLQESKGNIVVTPNSDASIETDKEIKPFFHSYLKQALQDKLTLADGSKPFNLNGLVSPFPQPNQEVSCDLLPGSPTQENRNRHTPLNLKKTPRRSEDQLSSSDPLDLLALSPESTFLETRPSSLSSLKKSSPIGLYVGQGSSSEQKRHFFNADPEITADLWGKNFVFSRMLVDGCALFYSLDQWLHPYPSTRESAQPYLTAVELIGGTLAAYSARQSLLNPGKSKPLYGRVWDALSLSLITHVYLVNLSVLLDRQVNHSKMVSDFKWLVELNGPPFLLLAPHIIWRACYKEKNHITWARFKKSVDFTFDALLFSAIFNVFLTMAHMPRELIYQIIPFALGAFSTIVKASFPAYQNRVLLSGITLTAAAYLGIFIQNVIDPHLVDPNPDAHIAPVPGMIAARSVFWSSALLYGIYLNIRYGLEYQKYYHNYPIIALGPQSEESGMDFHELKEVEVEEFKQISNNAYATDDQQTIRLQNEWLDKVKPKQKGWNLCCFERSRTKSREEPQSNYSSFLNESPREEGFYHPQRVKRINKRGCTIL